MKPVFSDSEVEANHRIRQKTRAAKRQSPGFQIPPRCHNGAGKMRRVGFEIEFSGLSLDQATKELVDCFAGAVIEETQAEKIVEVDHLGAFRVEIDWALLKNLASDRSADHSSDPLLEQIANLATMLVPVEVVAPPIPIDDLCKLDGLVHRLRQAGASGTDESLLAAFGVHINPELPSLEADVIASYVRACCLLQWWLAEVHEMDFMRKVTPYIDLYPRAYLQKVLSRDHMTLDDIFSDYLDHNATRNRAIDLLPLLAEVDEGRVLASVDDPRIKARPTIHYRFPDCRIENPVWSLHRAWDVWCVVERLASEPDALDELTSRFRRARRVLFDIDRTKWVEEVDAWLHDHELA